MSVTDFFNVAGDDYDVAVRLTYDSQCAPGSSTHGGGRDGAWEAWVRCTLERDGFPAHQAVMVPIRRPGAGHYSSASASMTVACCGWPLLSPLEGLEPDSARWRLSLVMARPSGVSRAGPNDFAGAAPPSLRGG